MPYSFTIVGIPDDGFTSAEISDGDGKCVGRVFELEDGWYVHLEDLGRLNAPGLVETLMLAKSELLHYVNRRGADFSDGGWTKAGASLWLMQRDDGKGFTIKPGSGEDSQ